MYGLKIEELNFEKSSFFLSLYMCKKNYMDNEICGF